MSECRKNKSVTYYLRAALPDRDSKLTASVPVVDILIAALKISGNGFESAQRFAYAKLRLSGSSTQKKRREGVFLLELPD